jgi:Mg-chelatase subunit ChlD
VNWIYLTGNPGAGTLGFAMAVWSIQRKNPSQLLCCAITVLLLAGASAAAFPDQTCKPCQTKHPGDSPELLPAANKPVQIGDNSSLFEAATQSTALVGGTTSTTLQAGTQSTMLRAGTESTVLTGGTQSTTLKGNTDSTMLEIGTKQTLIQGGVEKEGQLNLLILMDSSRSMDEALDGLPSPATEKKITVAKRILEETVQAIPTDINLGLRVFGQSFKNDSFNDCQQSVLTVPIGIRNRKAIIDSVHQLKPFGLTPLAYSLMHAERDFHGLPGSHHVVLISDGTETCGGDPCTYIKRLTAMGIKMKVDIVGFGLKRDQKAKEHLNCIASSSGGKYYEADTAGQLRDSIKESIKKAIGDSKVNGRVITRLKEPLLDPTKVPSGFR